MPELKHGTTTDATYKQLIHYFKYASSAYNLICPRPNGQTLVLPFSNVMTDIQGFVARDSWRKEIVVALRGSASIVDFLLDSQIVLVPLVTLGVSAPSGTRVHNGFLIAWDSVVVQVLAIVSQQLKAFPGFSIVTTGHSLGGALATLAAVTLKHNFPATAVRTYSYGAPRVGNKMFAEHVNAEFGPRAFRVVHTTDGVPTIIPTSLGYHHHGIEYWLSSDPPSKDTTLTCSANGEDPSCSASIPSRGITPAHVTYFGIPGVDAILCISDDATGGHS
ncbi:putative lipase (class 3) [Lyophyllum shimeji]|uniref:Lipase (Class 3) n=1 Tax=Lyophyllum shimeji TaxID=47721 RepID=A0A9P3UTN3_LYOSH|nr:putative lipase (class 3) [Lyophyllum shimeji]